MARLISNSDVRPANLAIGWRALNPIRFSGSYMTNVKIFVTLEKKLTPFCSTAPYLSPILFVFALSACMLLTECTLAVVLVSILGLPPRPDVDSSHKAVLILVSLIAPLIETFLAQLIPYVVLKTFGIANKFVLLFSMVSAFVLLHVSAGLATTLVVGVVGGVFLSYAFLRFSETSLSFAYLIAACCHFINNAFVLFVLLLFSKYL